MLGSGPISAQRSGRLVIIADHGYASGMYGTAPGVGGIAVSVFDANRELIASLAVLTPLVRFAQVYGYVPTLRASSAAITLALQRERA